MLIGCRHSSNVPLERFGIVNRAAVLYRYINSLLYDWYTVCNDTTSSNMERKQGLKWNGEGIRVHINNYGYSKVIGASIERQRS